MVSRFSATERRILRRLILHGSTEKHDWNHQPVCDGGGEFENIAGRIWDLRHEKGVDIDHTDEVSRYGKRFRRYLPGPNFAVTLDQVAEVVVAATSKSTARTLARLSTPPADVAATTVPATDVPRTATGDHPSISGELEGSVAVRGASPQCAIWDWEEEAA